MIPRANYLSYNNTYIHEDYSRTAIITNLFSGYGKQEKEQMKVESEGFVFTNHLILSLESLHSLFWFSRPVLENLPTFLASMGSLLWSHGLVDIS